MNLWLAKKVLRNKESYGYEQRLEASLSLLKHAYKFGDAKLAKAAFDLKPADSNIPDDVMDIRREKLEGQLERYEIPTLNEELPFFPEPDNKPVYRKGGQVHNFAALPYPGQKPYTIMQYQARTMGKDRGKGPRRYH